MPLLHAVPVRRVRELYGLPQVLDRLGSLELRLAVTKKEIRKAQRLRWEVFVHQGGAAVDYKAHLRRRDICPYDRLCDHLIVVDTAFRTKRGWLKPRVVGTYRLLRQDVAEAHSGFYSASEFDIDALIARHPGKRFLELGRSCTLPDYRSKRVLELLWRGLWMYAHHHSVDVMIGCASIHGTDVTAHKDILAHISKGALARDDWRVAPKPGINLSIADYAGTDCIGGLASGQADTARRVSIPPLVKGYLRLGARFGEGVFLDWRFGTTDVLVILPVTQIDRRYAEYFSSPLKSEQPLAA